MESFARNEQVQDSIAKLGLDLIQLTSSGQVNGAGESSNEIGASFITITITNDLLSIQPLVQVLDASRSVSPLPRNDEIPFIEFGSHVFLATAGKVDSNSHAVLDVVAVNIGSPVEIKGLSERAGS
jgi:hypothetical protein